MLYYLRPGDFGRRGVCLLVNVCFIKQRQRSGYRSQATKPSPASTPSNEPAV